MIYLIPNCASFVESPRQPMAFLIGICPNVFPWWGNINRLENIRVISSLKDAITMTPAKVTPDNVMLSFPLSGISILRSQYLGPYSPSLVMVH